MVPTFHVPSLQDDAKHRNRRSHVKHGNDYAKLSGKIFSRNNLTAYHLLEDWIRKSNNPQIPPQVKDEIQKMYRQKTEINPFNLCRDLANASKHFSLDKGALKKKVITNIKVYKTSYGTGVYGVGPGLLKIHTFESKR